jgi:hypothetical protein
MKVVLIIILGSLTAGCGKPNQSCPIYMYLDRCDTRQLATKDGADSCKSIDEWQAEYEYFLNISGDGADSIKDNILNPFYVTCSMPTL